MHKDALYLDHQYAGFGKVIEGMDVVDKIASVKTTRSDRPLEKVIIENIEVINEPYNQVEKIK